MNISIFLLLVNKFCRNRDHNGVIKN